MLLILAVVAAGGIFLLDLFSLHPYVERQQWAALRQEAGRAQHAARMVLRAARHRLEAAAAARQPAVFAALDGADPAPTAAIGELLTAADAPAAWVTGPDGAVAAGWSAGADAAAVPWAGPQRLRFERQVDLAAARGPAPSAGLIHLPDGPALFARRPGAPTGDGAGALWVARPLAAGVLDELGRAVQGEVAWVAGDALPAGTAQHDSARRSLWLTGEHNLVVAWQPQDPRGEALGYFRAVTGVAPIVRQAATSRRTVLIVLSLSVAVSLLAILGTHMLITGPVMRLLKRLQRLDQGEGTAAELVRDLHGEPLVLARRLESAFDRLEHISQTDQLTGLANRRHFEEVLSAFYYQARRYNRPLSLIMLDVDFFKAVNDCGGHPAGDALLRQVAAALEDVCRQADLPALLGGDEFAVLLPETVAARAVAVAERIRAAVAEMEVSPNGVSVNVTASIGLADLNAEEIDSPEAMLRAADRALYRAKEQGRNQVVTAHEVTAAPVGSEQSRIHTLTRKLAGLDEDFKSLFVKAIQQIVALLEQRDRHMADHARKVQHYAALIAGELGLPDRVIGRLQVAAMLHDVGMLALPDSVLLNPDRLDEPQAQLMRRHPLLSVRVMEGMEFLEQEIPTVRYHHERYDGAGYPEGIAGAAIPLTARILAVADCFDAMTSDRTYRESRSRQDALAELRRNAGTQFDPAVVEAFLAVAQRLGEELLDVPGAPGSAWLPGSPYPAPEPAENAAAPPPQPAGQTPGA